MSGTEGDRAGRAARWGACLLACTLGWTPAAHAVDPVQFSVARGWHETPLDVALSHADPDATIRFTLDGTDPAGEDASDYTGPLELDRPTVVRAIATVDEELSAGEAHTYLFLDVVLAQPVLPPGYPTRWAERLADYEMDPEIVGPERDEVLAGLLDLPVVSVSLGKRDLFDAETGIYSHATQDGPDAERPASLEWIGPDESWQVGAMLQMHGGASRLPSTTPKKGFRLEFKASVGPARLEADLFGEGATQRFDDLVLRPTFNHSWLAKYELYCECRRHAMYVRDAFVHERHEAMGHPVAHGRPVHLFLDGLYWGLYQLVERPDGAWASSYLGGDKEEWDALNAGKPVSGDGLAWLETLALAEADLADPKHRQALLDMVDEASLIDFMILNHWAGNMDWDARNWYGVRRREAGERWRFVSWDAEFVMTWAGVDQTGMLVEGMPTFLHDRLTANLDYRMHFADRVQELLHDGGPLTEEVALAAFLDLSAQIDLAIYAESARWGDHRRDVYWADGSELYTHDDHWLVEQERLTHTWFPTRADDVVASYADRGLFSALPAPELLLEPGRVAAGTLLDLGVPAGTEVYYTLDDTDPRAGGGAPSPDAQLWTGPMPLNGAVDLYARAFDGVEWSPRRRGSWAVEQPFGDLVVHELHYHPAAEEAEFVELHNRGLVDIELAGLAFTDGVAWQAPTALVVPAQGFVVLTDAPEAFAATHGRAADGAYDKNLSNAGERLSLDDSMGAWQLAWTWDDELPWDPQADGTGRTLALVDPGADPDLPQSWRASDQDGGTPFAYNFEDETTTTPSTSSTPTTTTTTTTDPSTDTGNPGGPGPVEETPGGGSGQPRGPDGCGCSGGAPAPLSLSGALLLLLFTRRGRP
jgi:hypothetical protein